MTKDEIFNKIDEVYSEHDGGTIYLNEERTNQIKEIIQQAINFIPCCTEFSGKIKRPKFPKNRTVNNTRPFAKDK